MIVKYPILKRQMFQRYKIILPSAIFILAVMLFGYLFYNRPSQVDIETEEVDVTLNSKELTTSFQKNEVFATSIYAEKVIEVEGVVEDVSLVNERVTVFLKGIEDSTSILCDFSDLYQEEALRLRIGETVRVKGVCKGFLKDVIVLNCKIAN